MADSTGQGHGGLNDFDKGANGPGTTELAEVKKINAYFRQWNPNWVDVSDRVGRTVNENLINIVNNTNRVGKSTERTLSHHMNAFNGKATGVEVWYYAGDEAMRQLATKLSSAIAKKLGLVDRGAKATTSLYVVSNTYPHCLLIEWCFVDNPNDLKAWQANGIAAQNEAMKVLGMKYPTGETTPKPPVTQPPKPSTKQHSVVVGSFKKNDGAHKALVDFLKKEGMSYKEIFKNDNVFVYSTFNFKSSPKRKLEDYLLGKDWFYGLCRPSKELNMVNNW